MTQEVQQPKSAVFQPKSAVSQSKPGMYKNIRGQKIFNAAGNPLKITNGYFVPVTAEEKELCAYFESIGNLRLVK